MHGDRLVFQMPVGEVAAGLRERLKILELLHRRNAGQFFAKIVLVPLAILRRMQQAVDVVENVFFGDDFELLIGLIESLQRPIGHTI